VGGMAHQDLDEILSDEVLNKSADIFAEILLLAIKEKDNSK
jgi:hypothetical protein